MNSNSDRHRIAILSKGELQERSFFEATYGLNETQLDSVLTQISIWAKRQKPKWKSSGSGFSRWVFETYCSSFGFLPPLQAAARIGMDVNSLLKVDEWAQRIGLPSEMIRTSNGLFLESFIVSIHENFPNLRSMTFSDQTRYLRRVHAALKEENVEIQPAYDPVASLLSPDDRDLSYYIDIITLEPIGLRYSVWMGFGKPITLTPDIISLRTYLEYESMLKSFVPEYYRIEENKLEALKAELGSKQP